MNDKHMVKLSWAERFFNYLPNTRLYIRKKPKVPQDALADAAELSEQLKPLFSQFYEEAFNEGYRAANK
jgi:hypothetical protein